MKYAPNARVIRVMCSGRLDPQFVLAAFAQGRRRRADRRLPSRRLPLPGRQLQGPAPLRPAASGCSSEMGIEDERFRLEWISASEGDRVQKVINDMVEQVRALGPLQLTMPPRESVSEEVTAA